MANIEVTQFSELLFTYQSNKYSFEDVYIGRAHTKMVKILVQEEEMIHYNTMWTNAIIVGVVRTIHIFHTCQFSPFSHTVRPVLPLPSEVSRGLMSCFSQWNVSVNDFGHFWSEVLKPRLWPTMSLSSWHSSCKGSRTGTAAASVTSIPQCL